MPTIKAIVDKSLVEPQHLEVCVACQVRVVPWLTHVAQVRLSALKTMYSLLLSMEEPQRAIFVETTPLVFKVGRDLYRAEAEADMLCV